MIVALVLSLLQPAFAGEERFGLGGRVGIGSGVVGSMMTDAGVVLSLHAGTYNALGRVAALPQAFLVQGDVERESLLISENKKYSVGFFSTSGAAFLINPQQAGPSPWSVGLSGGGGVRWRLKEVPLSIQADVGMQYYLLSSVNGQLLFSLGNLFTVTPGVEARWWF